MKQPISVNLTDTHLHEDNIPLVIDIWKQAVKKCQELKINRIDFLGDFFTARKGQSLTVDEAGRTIMNHLVNEGIELNAISGNHDKIDLESESSYLDEYSHYKDFRIFKNVGRIDHIDGVVTTWFLPYFKESTVYFDKLDEIITLIAKEKKSKVKTKHILLTHIAVNGVRNNDGTVVENHLKGTQFSFFDKVFVGHYHNQSFIEPNIYYIGSAYQANFGEDENKGFTILYNDGSHEFIQSKFKKFIQVKVDVVDQKKIKSLEKEHKNSDDNVRFVFTGEEAELKNISKEKFAEIGIEVMFNKDSAVPLDNKDLLEKASSVSFNRQGIDIAFETFCQMKHIGDNSIGLSYLEQL